MGWANVYKHEQEPVRKALQKYLAKFESLHIAAAEIGVDIATVRKWRSGSECIPRWMCEHLGFQRIWIPVPVGITTTGKTA